MSDVEDAVVELLTRDDNVRSLIGTSVGTRIFQEKLAQGAVLPALTYQLISDPSENSHQGPEGLAEARIQFDCWGNTVVEAKQLSSAVRKAVAGVRGTYAGVKLAGGFKENEMSMFDPDVRKRRRVLDMLIWHSED